LLCWQMAVVDLSLSALQGVHVCHMNSLEW